MATTRSVNIPRRSLPGWVARIVDDPFLVNNGHVSVSGFPLFAVDRLDSALRERGFCATIDEGVVVASRIERQPIEGDAPLNAPLDLNDGLEGVEPTDLET